ncbi:hypothetical protein FA95DRAFT_1612196 [Auriscalpium vulgare]|uniref:Uncharacterized protein n=1 Tax=Auriscalpium vulgare TaxID=40419 RepID=A0ACB8R806_9AGAM|nr:hypothetical protein FA95DRAFT_1612196 [Auriscalpium vulgare]
MPMQKRTADSVTLAARACESGSLDECATALQALHAGGLLPVSDLSPVEVPIQGVTQHSPTLNGAALARRLFLDDLVPIQGVTHHDPAVTEALARRLLDDLEARHSRHHSKPQPAAVSNGDSGRIAPGVPIQGVTNHLATLTTALARRLLDLEARHSKHHAEHHSKPQPAAVSNGDSGRIAPPTAVSNGDSGRIANPVLARRLVFDSVPIQGVTHHDPTLNIALARRLLEMEARHSKHHAEHHSKTQPAAVSNGDSGRIANPVLARRLLFDSVPIQGVTHSGRIANPVLARRLLEMEARHSKHHAEHHSKTQPAAVSNGDSGRIAPPTAVSNGDSGRIAPGSVIL